MKIDFESIFGRKSIKNSSVSSKKLSILFDRDILDTEVDPYEGFLKVKSMLKYRFIYNFHDLHDTSIVSFSKGPESEALFNIYIKWLLEESEIPQEYVQRYVDLFNELMSLIKSKYDISNLAFLNLDDVNATTMLDENHPINGVDVKNPDMMFDPEYNYISDRFTVALKMNIYEDKLDGLRKFGLLIGESENVVIYKTLADNVDFDQDDEEYIQQQIDDIIRNTTIKLDATSTDEQAMSVVDLFEHWKEYTKGSTQELPLAPVTMKLGMYGDNDEIHYEDLKLHYAPSYVYIEYLKEHNPETYERIMNVCREYNIDLSTFITINNVIGVNLVNDEHKTNIVNMSSTNYISQAWLASGSNTNLQYTPLIMLSLSGTSFCSLTFENFDEPDVDLARRRGLTAGEKARTYDEFYNNPYDMDFESAEWDAWNDGFNSSWSENSHNPNKYDYGTDPGYETGYDLGYTDGDEDHNTEYYRPEYNPFTGNDNWIHASNGYLKGYEDGYYVRGFDPTHNTDEFTITYHSNYSQPELKTVQAWWGDTNQFTYMLNESDLPELSHLEHVFDGWYVDSRFTESASVGTYIYESTDLYAKWIKGEEAVAWQGGYDAGQHDRETGETTVNPYGDSDPNYSLWNSGHSIGYNDSVTILTLSEGGKKVYIYDNVLTQNLISTPYKTSLSECHIGSNVTSIGNSTFSGCSSLTSITIPNSVTSIGDYAFSYCSSLTSVIISNSVTSIGDDAFYNCTGLTSIDIPNSVTSIGHNAFWWCSSLTSINIPSSVTSIGNSVFSGCSGLTSITVDQNNTVYDSRNNCNAIIKTSTNALISGCKNTIIPNSVTSIGSSIFYGCSGLTSIEIPNSVTSIGDSAFYWCTSLTSITCEAVNPPTIGNDVFNNTNNCPIYVPIDSVGAYKSAEHWSEYADRIFAIPTPSKFYYSDETTSESTDTTITSSSYDTSKTLTRAEIGTSCTSIGNYAFDGCTSLTSITIPNSVTSIGDGTLRDCSSLTSITIPNSVTSMGHMTFSDCSGLTSVTIPNSVTSIGQATFRRCSGLTSVTIGNGVTSIPGETFTGCSGLTSITIPNSVTGIGGNAFSGCTGLTSVTIPNSVTSIEGYAFYNCSGLTSVTIGNGVTSIGEGAFQGCTDLTSVAIGNSVTSIGGRTFSGCTGLTSVTIPNSVTSIGYDAFRNCTSLTSINIPNNITRIEDYTFSNCSGLTSITIPDSVTSIGYDAFSNCSGLTSITIPDSVTRIGYGAFYGCTGLTSIIVDPNNTIYDSRNNCNAIIETATNTLIKGCNNTIIPDSIVIIDGMALLDCSGLTSVTIPDSVTSIGGAAFQSCSSLTSITCEATNPPTIGNYVFTSTNDCPIYVPSESVDTYKVASNWSTYADRIQAIPEIVS